MILQLRYYLICDSSLVCSGEDLHVCWDLVWFSCVLGLGEQELATAKDRLGRVLSGILWHFRAGSPWRDIPEQYRPHTTCYNRFVR